MNVIITLLTTSCLHGSIPDMIQYPERYSEGVFAWCEDGKLKTSEEYQVENGGDPIVLKKYLLKSGTKLIN